MFCRPPTLLAIYRCPGSYRSAPGTLLFFISLFRFAFLCFSHGIHASAEILAVKIVVARELDGTLVAAFLLEIAREAFDAINIALLLHDLVEHLGIFHRADGERCGEVVAVQFLGESCGFGESEFKALAAALAAFGFMLDRKSVV